MEKSQKNNTIFLAFVMLLMGVSLSAGTTDNLGLQSSWTTVASWFSDGYIMKIIAFMMIVFAITLAVMKQYLYAIIVLIMTVIISNLDNVIEKFASAVF